MEKIFLNDRLLDIDKARISVADSGFLYGTGLFETMRSHAGVVFCLEDHLDRLFFSAKRLRLNHSFSKAFLADAIAQVLRANDLSDARLRLTLTSGPPVESDQQQPTLLITATRLQPYPKQYYEKGILVVLCPFKQNGSDPTCGHKTISYYPRMLALQWAHDRNAAEALWFTVDNRLAEGCVSNVFLVKDSVLYTPSLATPVLAGVARKTVCKIALEQSIGLVEKDLYICDLLEADEVFLTNVIMKVMPVASIEKHAVGAGKVGPMAKKLQDAFDRAVEIYCRGNK